MHIGLTVFFCRNSKTTTKKQMEMDIKLWNFYLATPTLSDNTRTKDSGGFVLLRVGIML